MSTVTADQVARFFVKTANESGDVITNLELQKLVYYAQAWHLALYERPLFDDAIEAWVHGPVVRSLYSKYKGFGAGPIVKQVHSLSIPSRVERHLQDVLLAYGHLSAFQLEHLTHSEQPWRSARGDLPPDVNANHVISRKDMTEYFKHKLNGKKA